MMSAISGSFSLLRLRAVSDISCTPVYETTPERAALRALTNTCHIKRALTINHADARKIAALSLLRIRITWKMNVNDFYKLKHLVHRIAVRAERSGGGIGRILAWLS